MKITDVNAIFQEREKNNCIYFDGSFISSAEFVLCGDGSLGYILDIQDKANISKEDRSASGIPWKTPGTAKFALVREFETKHGVTNPNPQKHTMLPKGLAEAIPTATCSWIPIEEVTDIAYVFHINDIHAGKCSPGGRPNAHFARRCRNPSDELAPLKEIDPFPNPCSFSKRMWDAGTTARLELNEVLAGGGQWDGRTKKIQLDGLGAECYRYWSNGIARAKELGGEIVQRKFTSQRTLKVMESDLSNTKKRVRETADVTRALCDIGLNAARGYFGSGLGIANPTPVATWKAIKEKKSRANVPLKEDTLI